MRKKRKIEKKKEQWNRTRCIHRDDGKARFTNREPVDGTWKRLWKTTVESFGSTLGVLTFIGE